jgi:hypothetical protein
MDNPFHVSPFLPHGNVAPRRPAAKLLFHFCQNLLVQAPEKFSAKEKQLTRLPSLGYLLRLFRMPFITTRASISLVEKAARHWPNTAAIAASHASLCGRHSF